MTSEQPNTTFNSAPLGSPAASAPPPGSHPLAGRRLQRRIGDRVIGGVAGGLGDYLNVDPILIRAVFAGLMIFGGSGFAFYVLGWLLIPAADQRESILEGWLRGATRRLGGIGMAILVFAAVVFILPNVFARVFDGGGGYGMYLPVEFFIAAAIAVVGVILLLNRDRDAAAGRSGVAPAVAPDAAAGVDAALAAPGSGAGSPAEGAAFAAGAAAPAQAWAAAPAYSYAPTIPPKPRESSPLGGYVLGAILMLVGGIALVDTVTAIDILPGQYFGAAILALGLGLVVGAWWGRARLLIVLGLLVLPVAWGASFLTVPLEGGFGERDYRPETVADLEPRYELAGGRIFLDLTELAASTETIDISARVGIGDITVLVPERSTVEVIASAEGGRLALLGRHHVGSDLSDQVVVEGTPGGPTISLHLEAGLGDIEVRRPYDYELEMQLEFDEFGNPIEFDEFGNRIQFDEFGNRIELDEFGNPIEVFE